MLKSIKKIRARHDKFFKKAFSHPKFIIDLLRLSFSKQELSVFDLRRLKLEKDNWASSLADLVISLPLKNNPKHRIKVFILLEHKAQYNKKFFSQLLRYQCLLHEHILKHELSPCPVYCVLFYHGKQPWRYPKSFVEGLWGHFFAKNPLFPREGLIDYKIRLINARGSDFRSLIKGLSAYAPLNLLERIWDLRAGSLREIKQAVALFGEFSGKKGDLILDVMEYLESAGLIGAKSWANLEKELVVEGTFKKGGFMNTREEILQRGIQQGIQKRDKEFTSIREEILQRGIQQGIQKRDKEFTSIREEILQRGIQQGIQKRDKEFTSIREEILQRGIQQGIQKRDREFVLNMLKKDKDIAFISEVTGLSKKEIKKLQNGS